MDVSKLAIIIGIIVAILAFLFGMDIAYFIHYFMEEYGRYVALAFMAIVFGIVAWCLVYMIAGRKTFNTYNN